MEKQFAGFVKRGCILAFLSLAVISVTGCAEEDGESATKGYLTVSSAETAYPYTERCAIAFTTSYPDA